MKGKKKQACLWMAAVLVATGLAAGGNCHFGPNTFNGVEWEEVYELDAKDYNEYYNNQLQETLGNDKYGNNGHFVEVWMDGAKGSGANAQEYEFQRWFATVQKNEGKEAGYDDDGMLFGAEVYTTVRWIGNKWPVPEADAWVTSGQFWGNKKTPKSVTELGNMYFRFAGHNAPDFNELIRKAFSGMMGEKTDDNNIR